MMACRRTSTLAASVLATQCRGTRQVASRRSAELVVNTRSLSSLPDHIVVGMPALSPTMTHGNIGSWGKQEGDEIAAGDVVCEVETDKATVDFDAQDDSFMAKHLVEAGTQDIAVGTPIFVTVDDADSVAAFKDFEAEAVQGEPEAAAPAAEAAPTPKEAAPAPAAKKEAPPAPEAAPAAAPASAPAPAPTPAASVEQPPAPVSSQELVFKRDWGSGVRGSALAHRMSAEQKKYVKRFGSTLQQPLDP
ncbi:unnamed protein product [Ectocarpus sp. CCAP 1310/34]|nr:unnamed protein product [Ectocarpus sp. CCAP 1310/34]